MFSENGVLSYSNVYFYHLESGLEGSTRFLAFFFFFSINLYNFSFIPGRTCLEKSVGMSSDMN